MNSPVCVTFLLDSYHGLGFESGALPDGLLFNSANGPYKRNSQFAYHGRLNDDFPYCYSLLSNSYLKLDLLDLHWIVAVAIQGYNKDGVRGRVSKVEIKTRYHLVDVLSVDGDDVFTVSMKACRVYLSLAILYTIAISIKVVLAKV